MGQVIQDPNQDIIWGCHAFKGGGKKPSKKEGSSGDGGLFVGVILKKNGE